MIPVVTNYTGYSEAQEQFHEILQQVGQGNTIVVVQRPDQADVAMISASELYSLLEEVYLLRSPTNAQRLFQALEWSEKHLAQEPNSNSLVQLRQELELELDQEKTRET